MNAKVDKLPFNVITGIIYQKIDKQDPANHTLLSTLDFIITVTQIIRHLS